MYYVDYGTTDSLSIKELRWLKKDFFTLPAQALHGKLANITYPADLTGWSDNSADAMLDLCEDKVVIAEILDKQVCVANQELLGKKHEKNFLLHKNFNFMST